MSVAMNADAEGPALDLDIVVNSALWSDEPSSERVVALAVAAAAAAAGIAPPSGLCVMLTDDEEIRRLNGRFRGQDKPTNVLSFAARTPPSGDGHLGDIAIAFESAAREAREQAKPFDHHLAHLAVHGFLHLLGYDHRFEAEAEGMEGFERDILARLGVPDPYGPALS